MFERDDRLRWWHDHDRMHHEDAFNPFIGQPCNGELFVKQGLNMASAPPCHNPVQEQRYSPPVAMTVKSSRLIVHAPGRQSKLHIGHLFILRTWIPGSSHMGGCSAVAIEQARVDGVAWLGHIDTDEFMYPASSGNFSMHEVLEPLSREVRAGSAVSTGHDMLRTRLPNSQECVAHESHCSLLDISCGRRTGPARQQSPPAPKQLLRLQTGAPGASVAEQRAHGSEHALSAPDR